MRKLSITIGFYLLLVILWATVFSLHFWPKNLLPSPAMVFERLNELIADHSLQVAIACSLKRLCLGYLITLSIGFVLGILLGWSNWLRDSIGTLLMGFQSLPSVAWVPLATIWFGLSETAIYFVIVMSSVSAVVMSVSDGIHGVNPLYLRAARTMGVRGFGMMRRVVLPAAFPSIITGLKLGWTFGWHGVVAAEMMQALPGLGFLLHMGRELADMSQVIGIMFVVVAIGFLVERLFFGSIERRIRDRWGLKAK